MDSLPILRSIGLKWRLLLPSLAAAVLCLVAVQSWTLNISSRALARRMDQNLDVGLSLLKTYLSERGGAWSMDGGKLKLGAVAASDLGDVIDKASSVSNGVATIFAGDERVATSVRKADGGRAIGTHLADEAVREAVLRRGNVYRGEATIMGRRYLTIYEPIRDASGAGVGILFVGLPTAELEAVQNEIIVQGSIVAGVVILVLACANAWLTGRTLRPLDELTAAMRRIA